MSATKKPDTKLSMIARYPAAFVLSAVIASAGTTGFFLLRWGTSKTDQTVAAANAQLRQCEADKRASDSAYNDLNRQLLIKNGVIDAVPKTVDSLIKQKATKNTHSWKK